MDNQDYKNLTYCFGKEKADLIIALVDYVKDPTEYESVSNWVRQCYNKLSRDEMIMEAINEILDGHGVEGDAELEYSYVNLGDTYKVTVLHYDDSFIVGSWGSLAEEIEARIINSNEKW